MPSGLVRIRPSPSCAASFRLRCAGWAVPVTAKPNMGSGASILCPPASGKPKAAQTSLPPFTTRLAISAESFDTGQPKMAMAMTGVPPIA